METKDRTVGITEKKCKVCGEVKGVEHYHIFISNHKQGEREYSYKRYRATCKDCQQERYKKWHADYYKDNKEQYKRNGAIWHQKNKARLYKKRKDRLKNDKAFKIKEDARIALRKAIKYKKGNRAFKINKLLGCTGEEAYNYLVSIGYDEKIHTIDHIIPYDYFDLLIEEHQLVCFNYRNLQPLRRKDNIKKSNHLVDGWEDKLDYICEEIGVNVNDILSNKSGRIVSK